MKLLITFRCFSNAPDKETECAFVLQNVSFILSPSTQFHRVESLRSPAHSVTAAVFRETIKESLCAYNSRIIVTWGRG